MITYNPIARWEGHGTILADEKRLFYRPDSNPERLEDWPEPGSTLRDKVRRLLSSGSTPLVPLPGLGAEVAVQLEAERQASGVQAAAERAAAVEAHQKDQQRRMALAKDVTPLTTGWKKALLRVRIRGSGRFDEVPGMKAPMGNLGIHRPVKEIMDGTLALGDEGWTLTHTLSGHKVTHGTDQRALRILAIRLALMGSDPGEKPTLASLGRWATIVLPFRRTGDPWIAPEEVRKEPQVRLPKSRKKG